MQFDPTSWTEEDQGKAWLITVAANEIPDPTIPVIPEPPTINPVILTDAAIIAGDLMIRPHRAAVGPAPEYASVDVPASWSGLVAPTAGDYIGIFPVATVPSTTGDSVGWIATGGLANGSTVIPQIGDLAAGSYQLRLVFGAGLTVLHGPTLVCGQTGFYSYTNARGGSGYANVPLGSAVGYSWWHYLQDFNADPVDMAGLTPDGTWASAVGTQAVTPDDLSNTTFFVPEDVGQYRAILHRMSGAVVVADVPLTVYGHIIPFR
jgi:hypothetical protein